MIYDKSTGALYGDDGGFIKTVFCPLQLKLGDLQPLSEYSNDKYCQECRSVVVCIDDFTDDELRKATEEYNSLCVFATPKAKYISYLDNIGYKITNDEGLPTIKTVRGLNALAHAQQLGFHLFFRETGIDNEFGESKYIVYQDKTTGKLWWSSDYRSMSPIDEFDDVDRHWILIKDWFWVRPDRPFPLAAYAVPADLLPNSRIFIEDVIDDIQINTWNQGDSHKLASCYAKWTGNEFILEMPSVVEITG